MSYLWATTIINKSTKQMYNAPYIVSTMTLHEWYNYNQVDLLSYDVIMGTNESMIL